MTLESEIYSIEAANINKETLDAMKNASSAMKQIHGGLTIDKVDQTMYVTIQAFRCWRSKANRITGRIYASSTLSAKKSARQSHNPSGIKVWTSRSWTTSSSSYSKRCWTTKCSRLAPCPQTRSDSYHQHRKVSKARHRSRKRRMRRRSSGSYKPRWPCNEFC